MLKEEQELITGSNANLHSRVATSESESTLPRSSDPSSKDIFTEQDISMDEQAEMSSNAPETTRSVAHAEDEEVEMTLTDDEVESSTFDPEVEAENIKALANEHYKASRYADAISLYTQCIELQPQCAAYYGNRAAAYMMSRKYKESIHDSQVSLSLDPNFMKSYFRASKCFLHLGNLPLAESTLQDGIKVASQMANDVAKVREIQQEMMSINKLKQFHDNALKEWKAAVQSNGSVDYSRAKAALAQIEFCMIALDSNSVSHQSSGNSRLGGSSLYSIPTSWRLLRVRCLMALYELEMANVEISSILSGDSRNSEALTCRAHIVYLLDSHPMANVLSVLSQALTFDPDNHQARTLLKKLKYLEAVKKSGNEAYAASNWALALEQYSKFLAADEAADRLPEQSILRVKVMSNRAIIQSKLGNNEDCIDDCNSALLSLQLLTFPSKASIIADMLNYGGSIDKSDVGLKGEDFKNSSQSKLFLKLFLRRADSHIKLEKWEAAIKDYTLCQTISPSREISEALSSAKKSLKMSLRKDYYKILNIPKSASDAEIKKAYRKAALLHHPDKTVGSGVEKEQAEARFKDIGEAYGVLSDSTKRHRYDAGADLEELNGHGGGSHGMSEEDLMAMFGGGVFRGGGFGRRGGHPFASHFGGHHHGGGGGGFSFDEF